MKKRRKKGKVEKNVCSHSDETIKFRVEIKKFLGDEYETALRYYGKKQKEFCKGEEYLLKLPYYLLKKRKVTHLRNFYKSHFGESPKMSSELLIKTLQDTYDGKTLDREIRKKESLNIDQKYISSSTEFFHLSNVCVPRDVMVRILGYVRSDYFALTRIGSLNSKFYLLILSNWNATVPINLNSLYKISLLILSSMKTLILGAHLTRNEFQYLNEKMTPSMIREIEFHSKTTFYDIQKFFNSLSRKKIVLSSCHTLRFPILYHSKKESEKLLGIPPWTFPNLRKIDNVQLNNMDISMLSTITELRFGDHFENESMRKGLQYPYKSTLCEHDFRNISFYHHNHSWSYRKTYEELDMDDVVPPHLYDQGSNVTSVIFRVGYPSDHTNIYHITNLFSNVTRLEIYDTFEAYNPAIHCDIDLTKTFEHIVNKMKNLDELTISRFKHFSDSTVPMDSIFSWNVMKIGIKKVKYVNVPRAVTISTIMHFKNLEEIDVSFSKDRVSRIFEEKEILTMLVNESCNFNSNARKSSNNNTLMSKVRFSVMSSNSRCNDVSFSLMLDGMIHGLSGVNVKMKCLKMNRSRAENEYDYDWIYDLVKSRIVGDMKAKDNNSSRVKVFDCVMSNDYISQFKKRFGEDVILCRTGRMCLVFSCDRNEKISRVYSVVV